MLLQEHQELAGDTRKWMIGRRGEEDNIVFVWRKEMLNKVEWALVLF